MILLFTTCLIVEITAQKWILKIAEKKDLTVYLQHIMRFER